MWVSGSSCVREGGGQVLLLAMTSAIGLAKKVADGMKLCDSTESVYRKFRTVEFHSRQGLGILKWGPHGLVDGQPSLIPKPETLNPKP